MKAIKKACSGTSLYPKKSSVSSKLKAGGKIKKAQGGKKMEIEKDEPVLSNDTIQPLSTYYSNKEYEKQQIAKSNSNKQITKKSTENAIKKLSIKKNGGSVKAKDGKWIQKAINPAHKGYCTPMTKATCTPKRKALAKTLRKISKKK